jgi:hypothetical protein
VRLAVTGIALGLCAAFLVVRLAPKAAPAPLKTEPEALAGTVLVEDRGVIDEVLVHYTRRAEPLVAATYRGFLLTLDPSTHVVGVVAHGEADAFRAFLTRLDPGGALEARTRIVETDGPISVWSKDRALVSPDPHGRTGLLVPMPPDGQWVERLNDWHTLAAVASAIPDRYYVRELPLLFDAGDFAVTGDRVVIDANLFAKNRARGVASPEAMRDVVAKLLHRDVVMLGHDDGDVPRHHLSMYMAPLGDGVALVGDPTAALPIVGESYAPGDVSPDTGEALHADFGPVMLARFERAAKDLAAAGFHVVRIPTVAFDDKTYFAYTNGVYETRGGKKIAWVPQYGHRALDAIAMKIYADLGWETHPVDVSAEWPLHGTIGCLANVLARSDRPY